MFEGEPKLRFSTVNQAKQFLIEHYGLFLEGHTSYVFSVAITRIILHQMHSIWW